MVRSAQFVLSAALLLAACTGGGVALPGAEPTTTPLAPSSVPASSTTTTPPAADPYAVPEVIDAAYVNRVLAALYAVDGEIARAVLRDRQVEQLIPKVSQIYSGDQLRRQLASLARLVGESPDQFVEPPGDRRATVTSLVTATSGCIVALVDLDFSQVVKSTVPPEPGEADLIALVRAERQPSSVNPTPWSIALATVVESATNVRSLSPCG